MALPSNPILVLEERWSTFYNNHGRGSHKYSQGSIEEDRKRLQALRESWLTVLWEAPTCSRDWPTTKVEFDQLMVLLRWEPSTMWKIVKEAENMRSAQEMTANNARAYTRSEDPVIQSDQHVRSGSQGELEEEEPHHTTSLRPNVLPLAYIRTFYNEVDEASITTLELKAFAYDQSLKQIDSFYEKAASYCKQLQKALQRCRNNMEASKLYDAFEKDHQMLANNINRGWIVAVNDKMRELGITVPEDTEDGLEENDETTNLELAAELLEESNETQSILTESNITIQENENASQASSSSTVRPESVRPIGKSNDKTSHQFKSEAETRARHPRPHASTNDQYPQIPRPEFAARGGPGPQAPHLSNPQRTHVSRPVSENPDNQIASGSSGEYNLGLRNKAYYRTNHSGWKSSRDAEISFTRGQSPVVEVSEGTWHENDRIPDNHFEFELRRKSYYQTNHPGWVRKTVEDEEISYTHGNPPSSGSILTSPPRYDSTPLPTEKTQAPGSSNRGSQPLWHSGLEGGPLHVEVDFAGRPGLEAQLEGRTTYVKMRNSTSLSNENNDPRGRVYRVPGQNFHVPETHITTSRSIHRSMRPDTRESRVAEEIPEASKVGLAHTETGDPYTSYPGTDMAPRRYPPNASLEKETPANFATSPTQTETESLNHSRGLRAGYSRLRRPGPEQPSNNFSAANTMRNMPPTSNMTNTLPSRRHQSHGAGFPSRLTPSNRSLPHTEPIQTRNVARLQDPRLPHEEVTDWHNATSVPGYIKSDGQGQQSSTNKVTEPLETTPNIDWQALQQTWDDIIENIYAPDAGNRAELNSPRVGGLNHILTNVAADDQALMSAEEGHAGLVSSDESDITDSDMSEEEIDVCNSMDNPSLIWPSANIDRTVPYAEGSRSAEDVSNSRSFETRPGQKQTVSWGKAFVYRINPEVLQQQTRTTPQGIPPRSALKK